MFEKFFQGELFYTTMSLRVYLPFWCCTGFSGVRVRTAQDGRSDRLNLMLVTQLIVYNPYHNYHRHKLFTAPDFFHLALSCVLIHLHVPQEILCPTLNYQNL